MRLHHKLDGLLLLLFLAPVVTSASGGGAVAKVAFPALATIMAVVLARRDPPRYLRLVLWTIMLSPGLRHFNDWHAGFSSSNPIMMAPYLVVFAATPTVALYLLAGRRYSCAFLLMTAIVFAGLGFSLLTGALGDPLMATARWLAPPWVAIYLCAHAGILPQLRDSVARTFRLALPIMAVYGLDQFANVAPWDAYFMRQAPINSIGFPVPFQVRVFGTMNSPGSLAAMLGTGIMLLLPTTRGLRWIGILLGIATLFLTTQRAAWGGLVVALLLVVLVGRDQLLRRSVGKMMLTTALACGLMLSIPGTAQKLEGTFSSVTRLDQDGSAQARRAQYENAGSELASHMLGRGLSWYTNDSYISAIEQAAPVDSGLLDILISFGIPGGMAVLCLFGYFCLCGLRITRHVTGPSAAAEFAVVAFGFSQLPFGDQQTAEHGMFLFLGLGLLLARSVPTITFIPIAHAADVRSRSASKPSFQIRATSVVISAPGASIPMSSSSGN